MLNLIIKIVAKVTLLYILVNAMCFLLGDGNYLIDGILTNSNYLIDSSLIIGKLYLGSFIAVLSVLFGICLKIIITIFKIILISADIFYILTTIINILIYLEAKVNKKVITGLIYARALCKLIVTIPVKTIYVLIEFIKLKNDKKYREQSGIDELKFEIFYLKISNNIRLFFKCFIFAWFILTIFYIPASIEGVHILFLTPFTFDDGERQINLMKVKIALNKNCN
jgi:hypothetical protein